MVFAMGAGVVSAAGDQEAGFGRYVQIKLNHPHKRSPRDLFVLYAHLSKVFVKEGQKVCEGLPVGRSGATGNARNTPPHLHIEVSTRPGVGGGSSPRLDPKWLFGGLPDDTCSEG